MKKCLFTLLLLIAYPLIASHIVGGEFELIHVSGNTYRLNLIYYFDETNGVQANKTQDAVITARIFRVSDNAIMRDVSIPFDSETPVFYTQPKCSSNGIKTSRQFYTTLITLSPTEFSDPQGYYITWERCCRNYQILNIVDDTPPVGVTNWPDAAGQTFYLQFPPVTMNGNPFINSSPRLFPPLSDYGCPGRPYYANFAGTDDDGDSLVYSIVTPLDTHTHDSYPPENPAPFPLVRWKPPFGLNNIMGGHPDLKISSEGLLTVTPGFLGLYVFAVKCEEFRDGIKIGEVKRDFQMYVVDGCEPDSPPDIVGKKLQDASFTYHDNMAVSFANTVADSNRCIMVRVSDPDSLTPPDSTEFVGIRAVPLNFNKNTDLSGITFSAISTYLVKGSTKDIKICFPKCPYINGPYQLGIIAGDDACSLPMTDTLKLAVTIQPPPNTPPHFTTPTPVTAILNEGQSSSWPLVAIDDELDSMNIFLITDGFVLSNAGMKFNITTNQKGNITGQLSWDAFCNIYDFTKRTGFQVTVKVDDLDQCNSDDPILAVYNLAVKLPGISDPLIDTDLTPDPHEHLVPGLVRRIDESLSFNVTGTQAENDFLVVRETGVGLLVNSATFPGKSGNGSVTSHFEWDIDCKNVDLKNQDTFEFQFVLLDTANWCRFIKTDTVTVVVKVLPPDNAAPDLVIEDVKQVIVPNNTLSVTLGEPIFLNVLGTDPDINPAKDTLNLQLIEATGNVKPSGYSFTDATGIGSVVSPFTWTPDCSIFKDGIYENDYTFKFSVYDSRCFNAKADTVLLNLTIKDISNTGRKFLPGNIITPNGDGCNDYFAVEGIDPGCGNLNPDQTISLPEDNCVGRFQWVRIHNRWGKLVYESTERDFRWYPDSMSSGIYFYAIQFTNSQYKGVLTVR